MSLTWVHGAYRFNSAARSKASHHGGGRQAEVVVAGQGMGSGIKPSSDPPFTVYAYDAFILIQIHAIFWL